MKQYSVTAAALLLSMLGGCAGGQLVNIGAYRQEFAPASDATYALQPSALDSVVPEDWLVPALASKGLHHVRSPDADYLVSVAYATRPKTVGVRAECTAAPDHSCTQLAEPRVWFAGEHFVHALTIQFTERKSGSVRYQVAASKEDSDPNGDPVLHALIVCALMDFPLENGARQEVTHCN